MEGSECQEEGRGQPPQSPALQGWEGVQGLLPELLPLSHMASPTSRNFSNHLPDLLFSQRMDQGPNPRLSALCQVPAPPQEEDWDRSQKGHTVALTLCPAPPSAAQGGSARRLAGPRSTQCGLEGGCGRRGAEETELSPLFHHAHQALQKTQMGSCLDCDRYR